MLLSRISFGRVVVLTGFVLALALAGPDGPTEARAGEVLDRVKADGILRCGVTRSGEGLSSIDESGNWQGMFIDYCRAIAAAVLDDPDAIAFYEVNDVIRFEALASDGFDVLMANTTWTITRDTRLGLSFTGTIYYDGQSFLAHRSLGAENLSEVTEANVCVSGGTTTLKTVRELVKAYYPGLNVMEFQSIDGTYESFFARDCEIITYDRVVLVSQLRARAAEPENFVLFPEIVSKEPLGPAVRDGDGDWFDLVRWTVLATIAAEELGVTSENVDAMRNSDNPEVRRLLGVDGAIGEGMGVDNDWAVRAIRAVGNYGQIFERHVGKSSPLGMERGLNALWTEGGLHYAPPIR